MSRVYVSSTFRDLSGHRREVAAYLRKSGYEVVAMEDYPAYAGRPLDKCLDDVSGCHAYVGLFAWHYGSRPEEGGGLSFTELELARAQDSGLRCFAFLHADRDGWDGEFVDDDTSPIHALRERLQRDLTVGSFTSPEQLTNEVLSALTADPTLVPVTDAAVQLYRDYIAGRLADIPRHAWVLAAVALALVAAGLWVSVTHAGGPLREVALAGGLVCVLLGVMPVGVGQILPLLRERNTNVSLLQALAGDPPDPTALRHADALFSQQIALR